MLSVQEVNPSRSILQRYTGWVEQILGNYGNTLASIHTRTLNPRVRASFCPEDKILTGKKYSFFSYSYSSVICLKILDQESQGLLVGV